MLGEPLRLIVDECLNSRELTTRLHTAGHDVVASVDQLGYAADDATVFALAKAEGRAILTADCDDFLALHERDCSHAGLLLVHFDSDARDMTFAQIVGAIAKAEDFHHADLAGRAIVLNHLR